MRVLTDFLLTPERAAIHVPSATAIVADLHLGYDHARRRSGEAIPTPSLEQRLGPLRPALARHGVRRLVIAGDLLEDGRCHGVAKELQAWLARVNIELVAVVPGNHDRGGIAEDWPIHAEGIQLGEWSVVHGDGQLPRGRVIQGHEHPCVRWTTGVRPALTAPCYLVCERRLILPAYSTDAAGVNVLRTRRWRPYRCCVIAGDQVLDFGVLGELKPLGTSFPSSRLGLKR